MDQGYKKAIAVSGNAAKLARELQITKANVYRWLGVIPIFWIKRVSEVTGIPMLELHPDTRAALAEAIDVDRLQQLGAENTEL